VIDMASLADGQGRDEATTAGATGTVEDAGIFVTE